MENAQTYFEYLIGGHRYGDPDEPNVAHLAKSEESARDIADALKVFMPDCDFEIWRLPVPK